MFFGRDADFLPDLAVEQDRHGHVRLVLAAGLQVIGKRLDADGGIAGAVPAAGVPAVVDEVLDEARGLLALRLDDGEQLEVVGLRFVLAAVPAPPPVVGRQVEVCGLVLVVLHEELVHVAEDHVALLDVAQFVKRQPEHGLGIDGQFVAVAIEIAAHLEVIGLRALVGKDHVNEGVEVVGALLPAGLLRLLLGVADEQGLGDLVALEPIHAALDHVGQQRHVAGAGDLKPVDNVRGGVRPGLLAPAAEPAPAAVGALHAGQAADAVLHHLVEGGLVEDRLLDPGGGAAHVAAGVGPVSGARGVVADLLRVEVGPLLLDFLEVQPHLQEDLLRDDRGQEAVERLLGAAVGIIRQVRQRVHHRAGERGRPADFEPRLLRPAFDGDADRDERALLLRPDDSGEALGLEHAVDVHEELHLHRVGFLVGERLHADDGLAGLGGLDAPVHALLGGRLDGDGLRERVVHRAEAVARKLERHADPFLLLEEVMDVRGEDNFVLLDEEARGLEAQDEVLGSDNFGGGLADAGAGAHRPDARLPGGQVLRHLQLDLGESVPVGGQVAGPERGVSELGAYGRLDQRRFAAGFSPVFLLSELRLRG